MPISHGFYKLLAPSASPSCIRDTVHALAELVISNKRGAQKFYTRRPPRSPKNGSQQLMQCSICLDDLEGGPTLACGHRFHAACLAGLAGANGTTPTRRGALTACPNCRTVSRVALTPVGPSRAGAAGPAGSPPPIRTRAGAAGNSRSGGTSAARF